MKSSREEQYRLDLEFSCIRSGLDVSQHSLPFILLFLARE